MKNIPRGWSGFVNAISKLSEDDLKELLEKEERPLYIDRLYSRYNRLRSIREKRVLLGKKPSDKLPVRKVSNKKG